MLYPTVSLIIPCYNEQDRVDIMMRGIHDFITLWPAKTECIIVDDGSKDDTQATIKNHSFYNTDYIKIITQKNTGKGGALKNGVLQAQYDFILTLDADMATAPTEMLNWAKDYGDFLPKKILIGSREKNKSDVHDKPHRKFIGNVFNAMIRSMTGLKIYDTQCGFKLYPKEAAYYLFNALQTLGWAHDVEVLCLAKQVGYEIHEMPITWNAVDGSKINVIRDSWKMFWELLEIRRRMRNK